MFRNCGCGHFNPEYDDFEERWRCANCDADLTETLDDSEDWEDPHYGDDGDFW